MMSDDDTDGPPADTPWTESCEEMPRSLEVILGLNPVAAFVFSFICALSLFGLAHEQAMTLQHTTIMLGWINIALVAAWAGCAYLGFIISSLFPPLYGLLSLANVVVSGVVLVRQRMLGDLAPYGLFALAMTLYFVGCTPVLYSRAAGAVFGNGQWRQPGDAGGAPHHRRALSFIRDLFWS